MGLYSAEKWEERFLNGKDCENINPCRQTGLSCDNKYNKQRGIDQSHSPVAFLVTESNSIKNNDEKPGSGMADTPDHQVDFSRPLCRLGGYAGWQSLVNYVGLGSSFLMF